MVAPAVLMVAWWLLVAAFNGFRAMFEWAAQAGPLGVMAMGALILFAFPVMLIIAIGVGFLVFVGKHS